MVLNIIMGLLVLGITFYQAVQGCFSAMIMAILAVLSAAVAFNFYEPLADLLVARQGAYAHGVAMLAIFVFTLLVLRILFDRFIRGNVVMGLWADRVGGGAFGLVSGMVAVGMLMIVTQLLPVGGSVLGYRPYDDTLAMSQAGPPRWAARFTLGLMEHLSGGSMAPIGEGRTWGHAHDDLLLESFCARNRPKGANPGAKANALEVASAFVLAIPSDEAGRRMSAATADAIDRLRQTVPTYPLMPTGLTEKETRALVVRVRVDQSARNETDNWWRLPAGQFRLVAESGKSFYPVGYLTWSGAWRLHTVVEEGLTQIGRIAVSRPWASEGGPDKLGVDWVYRLPAEERPAYVVFRRTAAAALPPVIEGLPKSTGALTIMAKRRKVGFGQTSAVRVIRPDEIEIDSRLPKKLLIRVPQGAAWPAPVKKHDHVGSSMLKSVLIDGAVADLRPSGSGGLYLDTHHTGGRLLAMVRCEVKGVSVDDQTRSLLQRMSPQLDVLLAGGKRQRLAHNGACLYYTSGGDRMIYMYYDAQTPRTMLDPALAAKLLGQIGEVEALYLMFVVPASEDNRVVGLTFGVGPSYDFFTAAPLILADR